MYVPLDVNFPDDDKIEAVGFAASGLYCQALCLAKRFETDGRLTRHKLHKLGADDDLIDVCVRADLFREDESGVWITAWLAHNESTDELAERRAADAHRKRKVRQKAPATSTPRPPGQPTDVRPESSGAGRGNPPLEVETEIEIEIETENPSPSSELVVANGSPATPARRTDFDEWWSLYPRKTGKQAARRKYAAALKRIGPLSLEARLLEHVGAWERHGYEQQFIPHPATWLEQGRWDDDPPGPRSNGRGPTRSERNDQVLDKFLRQTGGAA